MNEREDLDFVRAFGIKVEQMKREFDGAYIVVPENYQKFVDVYSFAGQFAKKNNGKVTYLDARPENIHGDITIDIPCIDVFHGSLVEFSSILSRLDVFGVTPTDHDSILVDMTVNNVWRAVSKDE